MNKDKIGLNKDKIGLNIAKIKSYLSYSKFIDNLTPYLGILIFHLLNELVYVNVDTISSCLVVTIMLKTLYATLITMPLALMTTNP